MERNRPQNVVRGAALIALALAGLSAQAIAPDAHQAAWRAYLLDVRDRGLSVEYTQTAGAPYFHSGGGYYADPVHRLPLAALSWLRIGTGTNAYSTNCWTGSTGATVCVTNYQLATALIPATNMIGSPSGSLLADVPWLQTAYTQSYPSADMALQSDLALFDLIDSGLFVDMRAVEDAGGLAAYFDSYTATNWYWVDTDSAGGDIIIDPGTGLPVLDGLEPGDTWVPFPQHPTALPILTRSNAWKYAGLEAVPVGQSVITNLGTLSEAAWWGIDGLRSGWRDGNLHTWATTNTTPIVTTNTAYAYTFPRAPTNPAYRAEIEQARIVSIGQHVETNVDAHGLTNLVTVWTTALQHVSNPATVPQAYIPPRLWSNAGARAYFTLPTWSNQPPPSLVVNLEGSVARWPLDASQQGTDTVSWTTGTNGAQLAQAFYAVGTITSAWRGLETSEDSNRLMGATVSIVYTNAIATLGGWDGFRSPNLAAAWSQRVSVLRQLKMVSVTAQGPQSRWTKIDTTGNAEDYSATWSRYVHTDAIDPSHDHDTSSGTPDPLEACGPDGLVNPAFYSAGGRVPVLYFPVYWYAGANSDISSRWCHDLTYSDPVRHWWTTDFSAGDVTDTQSGGTRAWANDPNGAVWQRDLIFDATNLWTNAACEVALVGEFYTPFGGLPDKIGSQFGGSSEPNGFYWPYNNEGKWWDRFWDYDFKPALPWPASYPVVFTDWGSDTTNDLVIAWQRQQVTNWVTMASDGAPASTNKLVGLWTATKALGVSNLTSGVLTALPTSEPPLNFVSEWTISQTWSDSFFVDYGGGWTEGRSGTSMNREEHYRKESTPPNSEGVQRVLDHTWLLMLWDYENRFEDFE